MKVLILAAGLGSRLQPLTDNLPKVMLPVGGKPVLEHLINLCHFHGLNEIIISTHYLSEKISDYFQDGTKFNVHLTYSHETMRLGSAGAIKLAAPLLANDSFIVLNGDVLTNVNLAEMIKFHQQKKGLATFLVHSTNHPYDSDIVEFDHAGLISKFFRLKAGEKFQSLSKSGTHIFEPEVLDFIPQNQFYSLEKGLIPDLLARHERLYAYSSNCYSKDMGTPERLNQVNQDYDAKKIAF
ncbi:MAG: nucleotidyltransferase family protein [Patescibacteria group bacterium]